MFTTAKQRIILIVFVVLVLLIPVGSYFLYERSRADDETIEQSPVTKVAPTPSKSPKDQIKELTDDMEDSSDSDTKQASSSSTISFGPTLNLNLILEGRPTGGQTGKVFVGISEGATANGLPKYVLSFTIDLPGSGQFQGLSLAGLNPGQSYRAYIKGPSQLATSSAFVMSPAATNLNGGNPITLLTGDLNEDNTINSADYSIAKASFGASPNSANWNAIVDFNLDNIVNTLDLGILLKNFTKTGDSGVWQSTPTTGGQPQEASASGGLVPTPTPPPNSNSGYWLWVPGN